MAQELEVEVLNEEHLSNPEALKILKKIVGIIEEKEGSVSPLLVKTLRYLSISSKMEPDVAIALKKKLRNYGLKDETIVMLINICPQTIDEARILLELEDKVFETDEVQEILETVKPYCKEEQ